MRITRPRTSAADPIPDQELEIISNLLKQTKVVITYTPKFEAVLCLPDRTTRFAIWTGFIASDKTFYSRKNSTRKVHEQLRGQRIFQELYDQTLPILISRGVEKIITETQIPSTAQFFQKNGGIISAYDTNLTSDEITKTLADGGHEKLPFTLNIETAISSRPPLS